MVAIAVMQIALWDTVKELQLEPKGFIGHSNGELICAYADGCFSAEETILMTHARGSAFFDGRTNVVGAMASVGMSPEEISCLLPDDIEIYCYN